ncbi:FtsW/RodA/SpoVE family cell cycle protein [Terribacillus saccharophilus]|uniref:Cell division protein FtsW n=1 Tax=Terribacillus saccharophilus TaxID=361277 RepID=A0ABX4GW10_9BACI|nr:FtsW/RodA/SpoVE family cell cycle protein [Terribacillus saccharophilus]PAD34739.1 cell division protein FtsW [Terribacillus saccharophilus]PAD95487.1 cell division protein FtsW [Terribacillus saccharophilus]PAD99065.1 cell division protein FtsW [Terribacillus saccharophilus]
MFVKKLRLAELDKLILIILCLLCGISILFIFSTQSGGQFGAQNFALKQSINYVIGFTLLLLFRLLDLNQLRLLAWSFYIVSVLSLLLLTIAPESIAPNILGAKRWFSIPFVGSIQPSEFFRISLIVIVAKLIADLKEKSLHRTMQEDLLLLGKILLVTIPPSLLVYQQPDTGMVMLYMFAIVAMLGMIKLNKIVVTIGILVPLLAISIIACLFLFKPEIIYDDVIPKLKPHQQDRIIGWLDPSDNSNQAFQSRRSVLAVGTGGLIGKGIEGGNVYVPEKHTDFIFASIAEEGGFLTGAAVILLFFLLITRILEIGSKSNDPFGTYICAGLALSLTIQIVQNIGMVEGMLPVKGIALPFLTYGGSSLFSNMILLGIVMSVRNTYAHQFFGEPKRST